MSLEGFVEVSVPAQVEDDVALASSALVEAYIVFDADLVQHIEEREGISVWKRAVLPAGMLVAEMTVLRIA